MDAATLLRSTRRHAGLSQRELAQRARTSAAAICLYERGARIPRVDTLERLLAAAGTSLALAVHRPPEIDLAQRGRDLEAVLDLADHLPQRHRRTLDFPPFLSLVVE